MKKEKIIRYCPHFFILFAGFFSWMSIQRAVMVPGSSIWFVPIAVFFLYIISFCLAAILVKRTAEVEIAAAISLFGSLIFAHSFWHFAVVLICAVLLLSGIRSIRKDLELNVKIDIWKSLSTGKSKIILALAIMISSQYLFMVKGSELERAAVKLDLKPATSEIIGPIFGYFNPNFKKIQEDGMTVDEFIIESQKQNMARVLENGESLMDEEALRDLPEEQREEFKREMLRQIAEEAEKARKENLEIILENGREELSQMVGREVAEDEEIADIFVGFVNEKINDFFQPKVGSDSHSSLFVYIMALLLFLTILPLGSILMVFCFTVAVLVFRLLLRFQVIGIGKVAVEREVIVSK
ncbi:MAG TPA: hypothetical protein PLF30_04135 [Candidatus Moranbacteria bacterium]|jgi:hypothetical protein|nr:hypothetical protein [Candidatus Moranbacteria bacterium]HQB59169.1 hypothetical protein [Candidatus Moranbacteria bacterium]